jgi:hypothetical protein
MSDRRETLSRMTGKQSARTLSVRFVSWSAVALAVVVGLSVLVGFVGSERGFGWELAAVFGTALGTTLLAISTGLLALLTARDVSAAQELAQLTRDEASRTQESLRVAGEQAAIARAALDAQTQPFLTVCDTSSRYLSNRTVHVRNAGNATAIVTQAVFLMAADTLPAAAVDPAMPPGESSSIRVGTTPVETDNFSVAVAFSDVSGRPRGVVRLDVYMNPRPEPRAPDIYDEPATWRVRQVFWADTIDEVRTQPKIGSQPLD